jgi:hypothetical protein
MRQISQNSLKIERKYIDERFERKATSYYYHYMIDTHGSQETVIENYFSNSYPIMIIGAFSKLPTVRHG